MVNVAKVDETTCFVHDPFTGTGSLLLMASKCGANMLLGSDIEMENRQEKNFVHFNLHVPDFINTNVFNLPYAYGKMKIDCIITDPPYGIRECRMMSKSVRDSFTFSLKSLHDSIAKFVHAAMKLGEQTLVSGGRLVFLFPVYNNQVKSEDVAAMLPSVDHMHFVFALPEPFNSWKPPGFRFLVCYERE